MFAAFPAMFPLGIDADSQVMDGPAPSGGHRLGAHALAATAGAAASSSSAPAFIPPPPASWPRVDQGLDNNETQAEEPLQPASPFPPSSGDASVGSHAAIETQGFQPSSQPGFLTGTLDMGKHCPADSRGRPNSAISSKI